MEQEDPTRQQIIIITWTQSLKHLLPKPLCLF
jgi:hypothetical protein